MAKNRPAKKAKNKGFVGDTALYQQRAALAILVQQANVHRPVFYKSLADEVEGSVLIRTGDLQASGLL